MQEIDKITISVLVIFFIGLILLPVICASGILTGTSVPSGAKQFAYERMSYKENVTILSKEINRYRDGMYDFEPTLWVTTIDGDHYRVISGLLFYSISENKTYNIKYLSGNFGSGTIWEAELVNYV